MMHKKLKFINQNFIFNSLFTKGIITVIILLFTNCKDNYTPKPTAYPRIYYPAKKYSEFVSEDCKYSFHYPVYSQVIKDKESTNTECFYNILYKPFNATLHITHHKINSRNSLDQLYNDTRKLTYKHTIKADDIIPIDFSIPQKNIHGIIYDIEGKTATNLNFFITDSTNNFIRGALYFNYRSNTDSVAPIFNFLKKDVDVFINNFEWGNL